MEKTISAIQNYQPKHFVIAGGVAANSRLRELILDLKDQFPDLEVTIPPLWTCTDNAAMIAMAAALSDFPRDQYSLDIGAQSSLDLKN